jgi:hypothetical protein
MEKQFTYNSGDHHHPSGFGRNRSSINSRKSKSNAASDFRNKQELYSNRVRQPFINSEELTHPLFYYEDEDSDERTLYFNKK